SDGNHSESFPIHFSQKTSPARSKTTQNRLFTPIQAKAPKVRTLAFVCRIEESFLYKKLSEISSTCFSLVLSFQNQGLELIQIFSRSITHSRPIFNTSGLAGLICSPTRVRLRIQVFL